MVEPTSVFAASSASPALYALTRLLFPALLPVHVLVSGLEFGITLEDKKRIGVEITWRLLQKIMNDTEFVIGDSVKYSREQSKGDLSVRAEQGSPSIQQSADPVPSQPLQQSLASLTPKNSSLTKKRVPPELRALMRQAMRDGSDWHPRLLSTVAKVTGMSQQQPVRSRIYVTSSSTMNGMVNVLAQNSSIFSKPGNFDLDYLSHVVIRCFEDPEAPGSADPLSWYTVEIAVSPGVKSPDSVETVPAITVGPEGFGCSLEDLDAHLSEVLTEFGHSGGEVNREQTTESL